MSDSGGNAKETGVPNSGPAAFATGALERIRAAQSSVATLKPVEARADVA